MIPQQPPQVRMQLHIWQTVGSWEHLPPDVIDRLPKKIRSDMSERISEKAKAQTAQMRIEDMISNSKRTPSKSYKQFIHLLVILLSGLTFSAGAQVLTARLGPLALPAAILIGAVAGFLVDDRATKSITRARCKYHTQQALQAIKRQQQENPPINELGELDYRTQIKMIREIEGKNLEKELPIDLGLAIALSGAEFATALWIVTQFGLSGGLLIEAIAASLPVDVVWIIAAYQSEKFELPEYYWEVIQKYIRFLVPPEGSEVNEFLNNKEAQEARIDFQVKFIAEGDDSGRLKNLGMAIADYDIKQGHQRKNLLEQQRDQDLQQLILDSRQEIENLRHQFKAPTVDQTGWAPQQIALHHENVKRQREEWLEEQIAELEKIRDQNIIMLKHCYQTRINQCEEEIATAEERYREAAA